MSPAPRTAPPPPPPPQTRPNGVTNKKFAIKSGVGSPVKRIGIYGSGGIGKSSLASLLAKIGVNPVFIDIESGTHDLDVQRVDGVHRFDDLRAALQTHDLFPAGSAVVIDSATAAERWATDWTLANVKSDKGATVTSIEGYGWGKGYQHLYETFLLMLGDLDQLYRRGVNVILIMHEVKANVPNPTGDDWIRYEPRLQVTPKSNIQAVVKEWLEHLFYVGYDVAVNTDGKGIGAGTRTIYPIEMPTHIAKSHTLRDPIPYIENDPTIWKQLFNK